MKSLPFRLGTDIAHVVRFDALKNPQRFARLARRILSDHEYSALRRTHYQRKASVIEDPQRQTNFRARSRLYQWIMADEAIVSATEDRRAGNMTASEGRMVEDTARAASLWLAGRWAAKEAARKAWGASLVGWKDVRVSRVTEDTGQFEETKPVKVICQPNRSSFDRPSALAIDPGLSQEGLLSISHDGDYAVATVIAEPLSEEILQIFKNRSAVVLRARPKKRGESVLDGNEDKEVVGEQAVDR